MGREGLRGEGRGMRNVAPEEAPIPHDLLLPCRPWSDLCTTLHLGSFNFPKRRSFFLEEFSYLQVRAAWEQLSTLLPQVQFHHVVVVGLLLLIVETRVVLQEV